MTTPPLGVGAPSGPRPRAAGPAGDAALATGLLTIVVWGYVLWWRRRPTGSGPHVFGAPSSALSWPVLTLAAVAALAPGLAFPLLGLSLLAFLGVDLLLGACGVLGGRSSATSRPRS